MPAIGQCYFCGNDAKKSKRRRSVSFQGLRIFYFCRKCGTFSLHPKLKESDFESMYSSEYIENVGGNDHNNIEIDRFESLKNFLRNMDELKGRNFLDFGCGVNADLLIFGSSLGLNVVGVEVETSTRELAMLKSKALVLHPEEFSKSDLKFDFIFLGDVLEHVNTPEDILRNICTHLKPNGYLFIQGPLDNAPTLSNKLVELKSILLQGSSVNSPPYHVTLFKLKSLKTILDTVGLKLYSYSISEVWWPASKSALFHPIRNPSAWVLTVCKVFDITIGKIVPNYGTRIEIICQQHQSES